MNETQYSNRELEAKFDDVHEKLDWQNKQLDRILEQVTKTNGRVTSLENKGSYYDGAIKILNVIVVPILAWALYQLITTINK